MQKAMVEAGTRLELINGAMPADEAMARFANVEIWVRVAQVHATNMQTEALKRYGQLIADLLPRG